MLSPVLDSGYTLDDSHLSLTRGYLIESNRDLITYTWAYIDYWAIHTGRFFPIAFATGYFLHYFINQLSLYKLITILFIFINIAIFSYFIYILTSQKPAAFLTFSLTPILFQLRLFHDPILGYALLMQLVFLFTILSLIFLIKYMKSDKRSHMILSVALFAVCILTYEIAYPFLIFIILIIYYSQKNSHNKIKLIIPFFILSLLGISIPILLRLYYGVPLIGNDQSYVLNPNMFAISSTLMKQVTASFPLSYFIFDPSKIFSDFKPVKLYSILLFVLLFILYKHLFENIKPMPPRIGIIGLFLLVLPAVVISLSSRYQASVVWGIGYIPVYISYFGLSAIFIYIVSRLTNSPKRVFIIIAIVFATIGALNYSNNIYVVENSNAYWLYPRLIIENGINDGLFNSIPDRSTLILDSNYPWDQPAFYIMHSKVRSILPPKMIDYYGLATNYNFMYNATYNTKFYLRYGALSRSEGYAILGKIENLSASEEALDGAWGRIAYAYVRDPVFDNAQSLPYGRMPQYISVSGRILDDSYIISSLSDAKPIVSGPGWNIYNISLDKLWDFKSLQINVGPSPNKISNGPSPFISHNSSPIMSLGSGFYDPEDWSGIQTRWMQVNATLLVNSSENRTANMSLDAYSFYRNRTLEISSRDALVTRVAVPTNFIDVSVPLHLTKGANIVQFHVPEGCKRPSDIMELNGSDDRCLSVAMQNLTVV